MYKACLLASAFKSDVLPHVHPLPSEPKAAQLPDEGVDDMCPSMPIHRIGADVDLGGSFRIGRCRIRSATAMIVTMNVQDNEMSVMCLELAESVIEHNVIGIVNPKRIGHRDRIRSFVPYVQAPCLFGR